MDSWLWRFVGGPFDGQTAESDRGEPPERLLAVDVPQVGWAAVIPSDLTGSGGEGMTVEDYLRDEGIAWSEYRRTSMSTLDAKAVEDMPMLARGAEYTVVE